MNKYQKSLIDFMKTGEIELKYIPQKQLIRLVEEQQQKIDKAIEYIHNHQLVFELSSKEQIQKWFDEFYAELLSILRGEDNEQTTNIIR